MCGRYSIILTAAEIAEVFGLPRPGFATSPRYNVAPTQDAPVVVLDGGAPQLTTARFGLIPFWTKGDAPPSVGLINARAETVSEKPAFRRAFSRSRCLVPADGFYEWQGDKRGRNPYRIAMADKRLVAFAGLCETFSAQNGQITRSFAIITTAASEFVLPLHDRMPAILATADERTAWLQSPDTAVLHQLLRPFPGQLSAFAVSRLVNSVANDGPECIVPVDEAAKADSPRIF